MEKTKAEIKICGREYTVVSAESPEYMHKIGIYIDKKMGEILRSNASLSSSMAAVLTAINIADEYFKASEAAENMRTQIGGYIDEETKQKIKIGLLKEENEELKKQLHNMQIEFIKLEARLKEGSGQ